MIEIKDHRLFFSGVTVALPNGLYLTSHPIYDDENIITFCDRDKTFYIELQAEEDIRNIEEVLSEEAHHSKYTITINTTPIKIDGLTGYYAIYGNLNNEYFEARVQNKKYSNNQHLRILIFVEKKVRDIESVLDMYEVKRILSELIHCC